MKKILIAVLLVILSLSVVGCANSDEKEAKKVALEYMNNFYNVEDFTVLNDDNILDIYAQELEDLKSLTTNDMREYLVSNRLIGLVYEAASSLKRNISIDEIKLKLNKNEDNVIYFDYTMNLKFSSFGNKDEFDELRGQIGLVKENNKWKVNIEKPFYYGKLVPRY